MSDSLIEQVRKCADMQKKWGTTSCFILDANTNARFNVDFPALLAELKRLYRVEAAARGVGYAAREVYLIANDGEAKDMRGYVCMDALDIGLNALDAALKEPS